MKLEITRKSDLAVRALCALSSEDKLASADLAEIIDATRGFTTQVMGPLVHRGWVESEPGPGGGYRLAVTLDRISFLDVIETIEGPTDTGQCVLRGGPCPAEVPCALHEAWIPARDALAARLAATSLAVACDRHDGGEEAA